jgi:WD40 repeat protein
MVIKIYVINVYYMSDCSNLYQYIEDKNVVRFAYPGKMPYISPDGTKIASEGNNLQIKLWSAETGAKLKTPVLVNSQYDKRVFAAAFSPNGELVARSANTSDRPLTVWDTNTGKKVSEQQKLIEDNGEEFRDNVFSMIFSNDGLKILAGCDKGELFIMDAKTGVIIKKFNNRRVFDRLYHGVTSVAFSPDDNRIASGANNIVKVWDAESGVCLATLKGSVYNSERAVSLAFSPNGEKIASGFSDKSVQVWDIESGELVNTLKGHNGGVGFVFFSPDGRRIISGCPEDRTLRVWDAETGKCGTILNIPENEYGPLAVTVLKDSNNKETIVVVSTSIGNVNNNWFVKNNTCVIRKWTYVDENLDFTNSNQTMGYFPGEDVKPPVSPVVGATGCLGFKCRKTNGGRKCGRKTQRHIKNKTKKHKLNIYNNQSSSKMGRRAKNHKKSK